MEKQSCWLAYQEGGWIRRMRNERGECGKSQMNSFHQLLTGTKELQKRNGVTEMHITENWDDERQRYVTVTKRPESLTEKASGGIDNDANTSPLLFSFLSPPPPTLHCCVHHLLGQALIFPAKLVLLLDLQLRFKKKKKRKNEIEKEESHSIEISWKSIDSITELWSSEVIIQHSSNSNSKKKKTQKSLEFLCFISDW